MLYRITPPSPLGQAQNAPKEESGSRHGVRRRMKLAILAASIIFAGDAFAQENPTPVSGCISCHGADGIAKFDEMPNLAGQNRLYLLNQLHAFQSGKRPHKEMRYMSRHLTEEEMEAIAAYFSKLPPR